MAPDPGQLGEGIDQPGPPPRVTERAQTLLHAFSDVRLVRAALGAGAYGYVLKDADPRSVICAVRKALRGVRPMSAEITELLAGG